MKTFLLRLFTWWNSQTFGTQWWTFLYGEFVGQDEFGNRYYRTKGGKIDPTLLFERRWVIYNGVAEASMVPPSWHGWLHHTVELPPTEETAKPHPGRSRILPNLTGNGGRVPAERIDIGAGPPPQGDRRLQGVESRAISRPGYPVPRIAVFNVLTGRTDLQADAHGIDDPNCRSFGRDGRDARRTDSARAVWRYIFNDAAPRPPADVPNAPFPAQPPPVQYPGQSSVTAAISGAAIFASAAISAGAGAGAGCPCAVRHSGPAVTAASRSIRRSAADQAHRTQQRRRCRRKARLSPHRRSRIRRHNNRLTRRRSLTTLSSPRRRRRRSRTAAQCFAGLDKITGRTISFDAAIGETVQFGALQVTARACYTRPPTEPTNTDAFVEVDEVTLQGEIKRIFTGWMFASSPGLHAVEHPVYDVWLTDCEQPANGAVAQTAVQPAPTAAVAPPAQARQRQTPTGEPAAPKAGGPRCAATDRRLIDYFRASCASAASPETGRSSGSAPKSASPTSAASSSL